MTLLLNGFSESNLDTDFDGRCGGSPLSSGQLLMANRGNPTGSSVRLQNNIEAYIAEPKQEVEGKKAAAGPSA